MTTVTLEGTQELMKQRDVAVIPRPAAWDWSGGVKAGKPRAEWGLATRRRSSNARPTKKAVQHLVTGKTFDNGVLCSTENSVVVDEPIAEGEAQFRRRAVKLMNAAGTDAVARS
jgi:acetaldehyde dehydrogenase (acetylating)